MSKGEQDFKRFLSYVETPLKSDLNNFSKYAFMAARFVGIPTHIAIRNDNLTKLLSLAKSKLPKLVKKLPDEFINKKIEDFVISAYKNPDITSFDNLLNEFSTDVLCERNIVVKLYNFEIEDDFYLNSHFELYSPNQFYKTYIKELDISDTFWKKIVKEIYTPKETKHPYVILVLKNIVVYNDDDDISNSIVKSTLLDFMYLISLIIGDISFLNASIQHSLDGYSVFTKEMFPVKVSEPGDIVLNYYKFPVQISGNDIKQNEDILNIFDYNSELSKRILRALKWLGKSKLASTIEDSFLYIAIAHECILSFNENTYISPSKTHSLAESLTFLIEENTEKRIEIYEDLKQMYSKRSAIVHSGNANLTQELRDRFFRYVLLGTRKIIELNKERGISSINYIEKLIKQKRFS